MDTLGDQIVPSSNFWVMQVRIQTSKFDIISEERFVFHYFFNYWQKYDFYDT
jgi:hypothetical protein